MKLLVIMKAAASQEGALNSENLHSGKGILTLRSIRTSEASQAISTITTTKTMVVAEVAEVAETMVAETTLAMVVDIRK